MTCIFRKTGYIIVLVYVINNIFGRYKVSNVCEICGKKKAQGATIIRRGLAKKKGGIGMHVVIFLFIPYCHTPVQSAAHGAFSNPCNGIQFLDSLSAIVRYG